MQNHQFAAPMQLLPIGLHGQQREEAVQTFATAVKDNCFKRPLRPGTFKWKEFRQPTKNMLMAIANSLAQSLPSVWNLKCCEPKFPLVPRGLSGDRIALMDEEKEYFGFNNSSMKDIRYYIWNFEKKTATPDWMQDESHYKLVFAADEGSEALGMRR